MTFPTITIIGAGNMGSCLIGGLIQNGHPADKLWATDLNDEKLAQLEQTFHINITQDNKKAAETADVIIFAVKPQFFESVVTELSNLIATTKPLVITVAAGIRIKSIEKWLNTQASIVRAMPNTPALIGCGATALYANSKVSAEERNLAESILRAVGVVVWADQEEWMDTVTALSGSGPAYFFLMMEALQKAATDLGLPTETARLLTLQTALGAAKMAIESGKSLEELRQSVTSPGGTTEKAIASLEENHIREMFAKALEAAKLRSRELADTIEK